MGQVATLRLFQLESIFECPALDVRQLVRNKRRKEYDSHTIYALRKKKLALWYLSIVLLSTLGY